MQVSGLKLFRDLYYIAMKFDKRFDPVQGHLGEEIQEGMLNNQLLSDSSKWQDFYKYKVSADFELKEDEFLVLGDNSAKSKDSRLWPQEGFPYYVKRDLLIGEALYIYWPHSWEKPIPLFPNFARMHFVR
jgi:hypothetical protein